MDFKAPRDPNTPSLVKVLRTIPEGEQWPCHVGSGECLEPAVEVHDDGGGEEFFVCAKHREEIHALFKLINEMTPEQLSNFAASVKKAE